MNSAKVKQIFVHPIKGLTGQQQDQVFLTPGHGIKGDRTFALMFLDPEKEISFPLNLEESLQFPWKSKKYFAVQNDWPGLAALTCHYDPKNQILTVQKQGLELLKVETNTEVGRDRISQFFTQYLTPLQPTEKARHPQKSPLQLVGSGNGETRYPDRDVVHISLLSQATLDQISQRVGSTVDVRRFRPNFLLEGIPAWEEFNFLGKTFKLGEATLEITARIGRCTNIEVNPDTGEQDLPLLEILQREFGHLQTGVLAKILQGGEVKIGDELTVDS